VPASQVTMRSARLDAPRAIALRRARSLTARHWQMITNIRLGCPYSHCKREEADAPIGALPAPGSGGARCYIGRPSGV